MNESKKLNCRWRKGAVRYTAKESAVLGKFREGPGWFHGARVYKVKS